jgi:hypothetical protein
MSIGIIPPPLGRNGLHCVKFLHHMGKLLLNLTPGEPLALMKKFPCFDNLIELDGKFEGVIFLGVHDVIKCPMFVAVKNEFLWANYSIAFEVSRRGGKYGWRSSTLNIGCKQRKGGILDSK